MKGLGLMALAAAGLLAQQPQVENAKLETRAFSGSLRTELAQHGAGPFWAAWFVATVGVLGPHIARMVATAFELPFQRHHGWIPLRQPMSARLHIWRRDACDSPGR